MTTQNPGYRKGPKTTVPQGQKAKREESALHPAEPTVYSPSDTIPSTNKETPVMQLTIQPNQPLKASAVVYNVAGLRGTVRFHKKLFASAPPSSITVEGVEFASPTAKEQREKTPRVKMTDADKAAAKLARANRTPQEIVAEAQARAAKTVANAEKNAAKQAKKMAAV